jgi:hypothetical protein
MYRTRLILTGLVLTLVLGAGTAAAQEVIYFTNGTTMPVRSHKVVGEMIHITLGSDASMAFPRSMVEKIEAGGQDLLLSTGSAYGNRMVPGTGRPRPVQGQAPTRSSSGKVLPVQTVADDPQVEMDASGVAVYRPYSSSNQKNKQKVGLAGHQRVTMGSASTGEGRTGTRRVGNRHVIGGASPSNFRAGVPVTGLEQVPPTDGGEPKSSSDDGGSSSSSSDSGSGN